MEKTNSTIESRMNQLRGALDRIRALLADALDVSKELDAPKPIVIGIRTALRLSLAELDGVLELLAAG